jgi:hypothetical protein
MGLNLLSKNNIGIVATLILVMLLSQSRFFDFLTETPLGRMILLAITILITYTNKTFGLLAVLFIICAFKVNDVSLYNYEGFTFQNMSDEKDLTKEKDSTKEKDLAKAIDSLKTEYDSKKIQLITPNFDSSHIATITSSSVSSNAREGFCMSDRELNILRGKQSNAVHVFSKSREQNNEIEPTDKSVFTSNYALF